MEKSDTPILLAGKSGVCETMQVSRSFRRAFLVLIVASIAVSGCLGSRDSNEPPRTTETPTPSESATQTSTEPTPIPPIEEEIPSQIAWNECQGLGSTIFFYNNVVDLDDGQTPPGWEGSPTQDDRYFFQVNRCERVSIGSFERGPATFLIETHTALNPPDACLEFNAGFEDMSVLMGLWVDDAELAAFLSETYHLPIQFAEFSLTASPTATGETHQWTWKSGSEESSLTAFRPGGNEGLAPFLDRLVWHNGTGVSFLDMHNDIVIPYDQSPPVVGVLAPPMKYAQGNTRPYSSVVNVWDSGDLYGPIFRFGDMECKELLG